MSRAGDGRTAGAVLAAVLVAAGLVAGVGCRADEEPASESLADGAAAGPATIVLRDVTAESGVDFTHWAGHSARRYLPETMGAGVAVFDADGDRDADLFFVGGRDVVGDGAAAGAFYRNRGDGTFEEATAEAGLGAVVLGMGVATGDVDGDGDLDLFVSGVALGPGAGPADRLYRNRGDGTFEDVTAAAGLGGDGGFSSSAAFTDADRDGDLDLFVGRYVEWTPEGDVACRPDGVHAIYCTPEVYPPVGSRLYRNRGDGTFADWSAASGVAAHRGKTLGVVPLELAGRPALAVANDTVRNFLFVAAEDGSGFDERAEASGLAYSYSGATRGAMGIDAGDVDGDGHDDLAIGNFAQEMSALYRGSAGGLFRDDAAQLGIGLPTLMPLAFGTLLVDLDLDGWLDLVLVNGHIEPEIAATQPVQSHAQLPLAFRNRAGQGFEPVPAAGALREPLVGRGLAAGDLDGDGDLDLVVTQNGGPARLLRNDTAGGRALRVALEGVGSNTTGYGAVVEVTVTGAAGTRVLRRRLVSGRSYLSASEPVLTFGLGDGKVADVTVTWPSGTRQEVPPPYPDGGVLTVREPAR